MPRTSWFDETIQQANFGAYMEQMDSWQAALADGKIDPEEIQAQAQRVSDLLRALEPKLDDALHAELTTLFRELAVLYGMERMAEMTVTGNKE